MTSRARRTWLVFLVAVGCGLVGLALVGARALTGARQRDRAAIEAQLAEDRRTALARMDQHFGTLLAGALGRAGGVGATLEDLHAFRIELPAGLPEPEAGAALGPAVIARADRAWNRGAAQPTPLLPVPERGVELGQWVQRASERSSQEYLARGNSNYPNNRNVLQTESALSVKPWTLGVPVPVWELGGPTPSLAFVRRVEAPGSAFHQVFRFPWPQLERQLLDGTRDLFPDGTLAPVDPDEAPGGDQLATLPARLVVAPVAIDVPVDTRLAWSLALAGLVALLAAAGVGLALHASLADAERQRRFTSAVTHELRTPLTTFRLYSDMLARGMVPEDRREEYLRTLESESGRLAALVENVLAHARLERQATRTRDAHPLGELLDASRPSLERRCQEAGLSLVVDLGDTASRSVRADREDLGLVLANLVDNACKYGRPIDGRAGSVRIEAREDGRRVRLTVRDDGPGLRCPSATAFRAFDRAGRDESDPVRGLGLGLALSRDVARALGGDLRLEDSSQPGASFALLLPLA